MRFFAVDHVEHVLQRHRLEVQPVGGIVIGRDRFGVAVEHDDFISPAPPGQTPPGSSSNRTRCPAQCGLARRPGSGSWAGLTVRLHLRSRRRCIDKASARQILPRRCLRAGRWAEYPISAAGGEYPGPIPGNLSGEQARQMAVGKTGAVLRCAVYLRGCFPATAGRFQPPASQSRQFAPGTRDRSRFERRLLQPATPERRRGTPKTAG